MQRAHVVQAVSELDQQHADVVRHRQHELAEIFRLLGAFGEQFELGELGDAVDKAGDFLAEILLDVVIGDVGVFDRVVQQRRRDRGHVELELGQDAGDFQRMGEIGIARSPELLAMGLHGKDIGLVEDGLVGVGVVGFDPVDELGLAHELAPHAALGLGTPTGVAAGTGNACPPRGSSARWVGTLMALNIGLKRAGATKSAEHTTACPRPTVRLRA